MLPARVVWLSLHQSDRKKKLLLRLFRQPVQVGHSPSEKMPRLLVPIMAPNLYKVVRDQRKAKSVPSIHNILSHLYPVVI